MKHEPDYGKYIDRTDTFSMKWEDGPQTLPFWVADMDIACAPAVVEAIEKRAASPVYGYTDIPEVWARAYSSWFQKEHGWNLQPKELVYTNGIICALSSLIRRFSVPAEKVIVLTPVYPVFFNSILNNGRVPLEVPLKYIDDQYSIDFEKLEQAMQDPQASLMILCNPHNPTGNLWKKDELLRIAKMAADHGILIISDEVHCDIVRPGRQYVPFAPAARETGTAALILLSPSKAFNVAGIHTAAIAASDPVLRHRAWRAVNTDEVGEPNVFSVQTAIAAYTQSREWLTGLQRYLFENRDTAQDFIRQHIPDLVPVAADSLYLLWLDASRYGEDTDRLVQDLRRNWGIRLSAGTDFRGNGSHFLRMNLACPRDMLLEGLKRLEQALHTAQTASRKA